MTDGAEVAPDDRELLRRMRAGDTAALDVLLRRHWPAVVAYVARMGDAPDTAEDIAQRTFLRLWERRAEWRSDGSLRALLYRIARNFAVSEFRSDRARERAEATRAAEIDEAVQPSALRGGHELRAALDTAIDALPERRREVFVLRCMHDLSYREIADIMGITTQTVANQLSSALATLRSTLEPLLGE